jgi:hypothetical protein
VILYLSFEELAALSASAESLLAAAALVEHGIVAPSTHVLDEIEHFAGQLNGDIVIASLDDHARMHAVVRHLLAECKLRMHEAVLLQHAAAESAVAAYFSYAHVLTVENRLERIGEEMTALAQLMTGEEPGSEAARRFIFPE